MKLIFLTFFLVQQLLGVQRPPCKLEWVDYSIGDKLPVNLTFSQPDKMVVARTSDMDKVGSVDITGDLKKIKTSGGGDANDASYQFLTNPKGCEYKWVKDLRGNDYNTRAGKDDDWVFRKENDGVWVGNGHHQTEDDIQALYSESPGLRFEIYDFHFPEEQFDDYEVDLVGTDTIHNKSPAEITVTLTHTKSVAETTTVSTTTSMRHTAGGSVTGGYGPASISAHYEFSTETSETNTFSTEKRKEISISRAISVPPLTTIEACSVLKSMENQPIFYNAKIRFTLDGLKGHEIRSMISQDYPDDKIIYVGHSNVTAHIDGHITANAAMQSEFIIVPTESIQGCLEMSEIIAKRNNAKQGGELKKIKMLNDEVNRLYTQITSMNLIKQ